MTSPKGPHQDLLPEPPRFWYEISWTTRSGTVCRRVHGPITEETAARFAAESDNETWTKLVPAGTRSETTPPCCVSCGVPAGSLPLSTIRLCRVCLVKSERNARIVAAVNDAYEKWGGDHPFSASGRLMTEELRRILSAGEPAPSEEQQVDRG